MIIKRQDEIQAADQKNLELLTKINEQPLVQDSELTGVIKEINEDLLSSEKLSGVDMKTRLNGMEIPSIIIHDVLVAFNILPTQCSTTTRLKKRLAISINGLGRREIIDIVRPERERKQGGFFSRMFTPKKMEE